MKGVVSHELEVAVPADEPWAIYSTLRFVELAVEFLPNVLSKFTVEQGDGGVGTILRLDFAPEIPGIKYYKEKFMKIDHEKRVKEVIIAEGGYLDLGFTSYLVRIEILEKSIDSSIIKSTIEYEVDEEHKENASLITTVGLSTGAEVVAKYLLEKKAI